MTHFERHRATIDAVKQRMQSDMLDLRKLRLDMCRVRDVEMRALGLRSDYITKADRIALMHAADSCRKWYWKKYLDKLSSEDRVMLEECFTWASGKFPNQTELLIKLTRIWETVINLVDQKPQSELARIALEVGDGMPQPPRNILLDCGENRLNRDAATIRVGQILRLIDGLMVSLPVRKN